MSCLARLLFVICPQLSNFHQVSSFKETALNIVVLSMIFCFKLTYSFKNHGQKNARKVPKMHFDCMVFSFSVDSDGLFLLTIKKSVSDNFLFSYPNGV